MPLGENKTGWRLTCFRYPIVLLTDQIYSKVFFTDLDSKTVSCNPSTSTFAVFRGQCKAQQAKLINFRYLIVRWEQHLIDWFVNLPNLSSSFWSFRLKARLWRQPSTTWCCRRGAWWSGDGWTAIWHVFPSFRRRQILLTHRWRRSEQHGIGQCRKDCTAASMNEIKKYFCSHQIPWRRSNSLLISTGLICLRMKPFCCKLQYHSCLGKPLPSIFCFLHFQEIRIWMIRI